ncbi:MAG: hypothetical protein BWY11_00326 [Firmicutes bacterium ADurb.Bin182]|nr:MAG: hypothetical protein BWY11_00326 [Firmicutes bacterium ADurb.Bin182]
MEEAKNLNETIEQLTELPSQSELKKRAGMYFARDVDRYIEKLQLNARSMEALFHERSEEMRTLLMSVTRERDEYRSKLHEMEKSISQTEIRTVEELEMKGYKALPAAEYQMLVRLDEDSKRMLDQLEAKVKRLAEENAGMAKELKESAGERKESRAVISQVEKLKELLVQREKELQEKTEELTASYIRLNELETAAKDNAAALLQLRNKCATLELNEKLLQNEFVQLQNDKDRAVKEASAGCERWKAERDAFVRRYKVLLTGQRQSMQRLQENVTAAVKYMESLGESALISLGLEDI